MCEVQAAGTGKRQHVNEAVLDRDCKDRCVAPGVTSVVPCQELLVSELVRYLALDQGRCPWQDIDSQITKQDVLEYTGSIPVLEQYQPMHVYLDDPDPERFRLEHIQRIAWIMRNQDAMKPIAFDIDQWECPELIDGYHRVHAAWFSNKITIPFQMHGWWKPYRTVSNFQHRTEPEHSDARRCADENQRSKVRS